MIQLTVCCRSVSVDLAPIWNWGKFNSNTFDSLKLRDDKSVSSLSKWAKLSEQNNNQFDIDDEDNMQDIIQTNFESLRIKSEYNTAQNGQRKYLLTKKFINSFYNYSQKGNPQ